MHVGCRFRGISTSCDPLGGNFVRLAVSLTVLLLQRWIWTRSRQYARKWCINQICAHQTGISPEPSARVQFNGALCFLSRIVFEQVSKGISQKFWQSQTTLYRTSSERSLRVQFNGLPRFDDKGSNNFRNYGILIFTESAAGLGRCTQARRSVTVFREISRSLLRETWSGVHLPSFNKIGRLTKSALSQCLCSTVDRTHLVSSLYKALVSMLSYMSYKTIENKRK